MTSTIQNGEGVEAAFKAGWQSCCDTLAYCPPGYELAWDNYRQSLARESATADVEREAGRLAGLQEAAMIAQTYGVPGGYIANAARGVADAIRRRAALSRAVPSSEPAIAQEPAQCPECGMGSPGHVGECSRATVCTLGPRGSFACPICGDDKPHTHAPIVVKAYQEQRHREPPSEPAIAEGEREARFWLIVHEPGKVPDRKGPWLSTGFREVMRDFIGAYPTAYLTVLTVDVDGTPWAEHGPEALQMADGRSMSLGRKHNARTLAAHTAALAQSSTPPASKGVEDALAAIGRKIDAGEVAGCKTKAINGVEWLVTPWQDYCRDLDNRFERGKLAASPTPSNDSLQGREEVEQAAVAIAKVLGIDLHEQCGSNDDGPCDSDTCPGALTEDHDTEEHRERIYRMARAALQKDTRHDG